MPAPEKRYEGIYNDKYGGMTQQGQIVKDAWAFGLISESETCEGWQAHQLDELWRKVVAEKDKYGPSVSFWPEEVRERYVRIHREAMERARAQGWDPDAELADEV